MEQQEFRGKLECVQVLRAFLALSIALYHFEVVYNTGLKFGSAVHVFFVLSAFLSMYTTQRNPTSFIRKKLLRLLPLYWLLTIGTFFLIRIAPSLINSDGDVSTLVSSLLCIPHYRAASRINQIARPLVGPAWTLYYEVLFVFIFGISMKVSHKYRGIISMIVCVSLPLLRNFVSDSNAFVDVYFNNYLLDYAAGIVLYYLLKSTWRWPIPRPMKPFLYLGVIGVSLFLIIPNPVFEMFPVLRAVAAMIIVFNIIIIYKKKELSGILVHLGDISYSFWLIHYYVILIVGKILDISNFNFTAIAGIIGAITFAIIISEVSYWIVEVWFTGFIRRQFDW